MKHQQSMDQCHPHRKPPLPFAEDVNPISDGNHR